ncbi:MAG: glucokinase, partial [Pseudomonadota bacterium]
MTGTIDLKFPVLIGDIGGTNARFQIIERANATPIVFETVQTANFDTMEQAIEHSVLNQANIQPRCALIAAAGPITDNGLDLTNCHWNIVPNQLLSLASIEQLVLMNDFEAQALALPCLTSNDGVSLGGGKPNIDGEYTK